MWAYADIGVAVCGLYEEKGQVRVASALEPCQCSVALTCVPVLSLLHRSSTVTTKV